MVDISKMIKEMLENDAQEQKMSEKQKKIVAAAIEMFAEKGFAATSTSEIAKKAGVAEGTIFRHYKTKKDLLLSIVMPTVVKYIAPFFAKSFVKEVFDNEHASFESFLRNLVHNRYEFAKQHYPTLRIFIQEVFYHEELRDQFKFIFQEHVYEKFVKIIQHFQEKGEVIAAPPEVMMRHVMSSVLGFMVNRFIIAPDKAWDDEKEIEQTIQFILYGLKK